MLFLLPFQQKIEKSLKKALESWENNSKLTSACIYAIQNGGKRYRPLVVQLVAEALGKNAEVLEAALAVEFFHTASLIADDLPCMDNEEKRRGKPAIHKQFKESVAILASYALISLGYEYIYRNTQTLQTASLSFSSKAEKILALSIQIVTQAAGLQGAPYGQFLDLYPPNQEISTLEEMIHKKTGTLFEISFGLGWLFGGGDFDHLPEIKKAAKCFGMAFQIIDDLQDQKEDIIRFNLVQQLGSLKAIEYAEKNILLFEESMKSLGIYSSYFQKLLSLLQEKIPKPNFSLS